MLRTWFDNVSMNGWYKLNNHKPSQIYCILITNTIQNVIDSWLQSNHLLAHTLVCADIFLKDYPLHRKTRQTGRVQQYLLFCSPAFSLERNLWPSSNKLSSCTFSLKRATAASKSLDFWFNWRFYSEKETFFFTQQGLWSGNSCSSGSVLFSQSAKTIGLKNLSLFLSTEWSQWKIMHDRCLSKVLHDNKCHSNWH